VRLRYGILASIVLIACALALLAPAATLERLMPEGLPVRLASCSGMLLQSGNCRVLVHAKSGWMNAGVVSYTWDFGSERGVRLRLAHDGDSAGSLQPTLRGWTATDIMVRLPVILPDVLPGNTNVDWRLTGRQVVTIPSLACRWGYVVCVGRGRLEITDLTVGLISRDPFGSYALDLEFMQDGHLAGRVATVSGLLRVEGQVEKSPSKELRVFGRIKLGDGATEDFRRILGTIAHAENSDTFAFSFPR
jgi:hypothetical protein